MMSYLDFPTVGCLLSWEISKITLTAIASVRFFHNLNTVTSRRKMLRLVIKCYFTSHIIFRGYGATLSGERKGKIFVGEKFSHF